MRLYPESFVTRALAMLKDKFHMMVATPSTHNAHDEAVHIMDMLMDQELPMQRFMAELCRDGNDAKRGEARREIYGVFMDDVQENGCLLRSYKDGVIICDSWWAYNAVPTTLDMIVFVWNFFTSIFWRGLHATGWRKMVGGIKLLFATKNAVPRRWNGKPVAFIELQNIVVRKAWHGKHYASAHIALMCALADRQGVATKLCTPDPKNIPYYERFGFVNKGQIPGVPEKFGYYHWMVRGYGARQNLAQILGKDYHRP